MSMNREELAFFPAFKLAQMVRDEEISSVELVGLYLSRIDKYNKSINAVITLDAQRALEKAKQKDRQRSSGRRLGPLHGVPVTIKDSLETADILTTSGDPNLRGLIPSTNADAVQRYLDAGAIIMGKTNLPMGASDWQTFNTIFGVTHNPWDVTRTPGGSSGGSAAALAAGLTGLELGSDIGGSIRIPSHFCGVYGHKPSYGIVPQAGHIPPGPGTLVERDLSVIGPLARSPEDLSLALDILVAPRQKDSVAWHLDLPQPRKKTIEEYRVAAWFEDSYIPTDRRYVSLLQDTVDALRRAGATVDERARPGFSVEEALQLYRRLLYPILISSYPERVFEALQQIAGDDSSEIELKKLAKAATISHRKWLADDALRQHYRSLWEEFFIQFDVLLSPVTSLAAFEHDHQRDINTRVLRINDREEPYNILMNWVGLATMCYLPATVAPVGRTEEGLPVGIQIIGPYLEDKTPIDFAQKLSRVIGGFQAPPGY